MEKLDKKNLVTKSPKSVQMKFWAKILKYFGRVAIFQNVI